MRLNPNAARVQLLDLALCAPNSCATCRPNPRLKNIDPYYAASRKHEPKSFWHNFAFKISAFVQRYLGSIAFQSSTCISQHATNLAK